MDYKREKADQLIEAGIPIDDFEQAMDLISEDEMEFETEDPVEQFRLVIVVMNDEGVLPESLSEYCDRFRVVYNKPEINFPPNDEAL